MIWLLMQRLELEKLQLWKNLLIWYQIPLFCTLYSTKRIRLRLKVNSLKILMLWPLIHSLVKSYIKCLNVNLRNIKQCYLFPKTIMHNLRKNCKENLNPRPQRLLKNVSLIIVHPVIWLLSAKLLKNSKKRKSLLITL